MINSMAGITHDDYVLIREALAAYRGYLEATMPEDEFDRLPAQAQIQRLAELRLELAQLVIEQEG